MIAKPFKRSPGDEDCKERSSLQGGKRQREADHLQESYFRVASSLDLPFK